MAKTKTHRPVLLVSAIFANKTASLEWAASKLTQEFGKIQISSRDEPFDQTQFYTKEMGENLVKRFVAFQKLVDPSKLPQAKNRSNEIEQELARASSGSVERPVNIDPGYVTEAKLVLATTKDRDHRIYLGEDIYGEITLYFQQQRWNASRWTYPDYQTEQVFSFLDECRVYLRSLYQRG